MSSDNVSTTEHDAIKDQDFQNTSISTLVQTRHSTRAFLRSKQVPNSTLYDCLEAARNSPSNTNHQPWRLYFMTGDRLESTRSALMGAVKAGVKSSLPATPQEYNRFRSDLGHQLYGEHGYNISRGDKEGMEKARLRNFEFFGAPTVAAVCIPIALAERDFMADIMSVGLYLETLVLLLAAKGVNTCMQVAPTGYSDVVLKAMGIENEGVELICTLAVGYEDPADQVNNVRVKREEYKDNVKFLDWTD